MVVKATIQNNLRSYWQTEFFISNRKIILFLSFYSLKLVLILSSVKTCNISTRANCNIQSVDQTPFVHLFAPFSFSSGDQEAIEQSPSPGGLLLVGKVSRSLSPASLPASLPSFASLLVGTNASSTRSKGRRTQQGRTGEAAAMEEEEDRIEDRMIV